MIYFRPGATDKREKPLKNKTKQITGLVAVMVAAAGFIAWLKINNDLDEFFGSFREMLRYVSFHAR